MTSEETLPTESHGLLMDQLKLAGNDAALFTPTHYQYSLQFVHDGGIIGCTVHLIASYAMAL